MTDTNKTEQEPRSGLSDLTVKLAADTQKMRNLLDAAEAVHQVCHEKWGDTNGVTIDAKMIMDYFKLLADNVIRVERHPRRQLAYMQGDRQRFQRSKKLDRAWNASWPVGRSSER